MHCKQRVVDPPDAAASPIGAACARIVPIGSPRAVHSGSFAREAFVPYVISSRGRPIGTTDLDFERIPGSSRSGWFHPNALGETLMPTIALVLPAMRAFVCRNAHDDDGRRIVLPNFRASSLFADLAEALHRVDAMELALHHADGALIATSQIGIQDTEQLLALSAWPDLDPDPDGANDDDCLEENFGLELVVDPEIEFDLARTSERWRAEGFSDLDELDDLDDLWAPYEEPPDLPRYQVHVDLVDVRAIP